MRGLPVPSCRGRSARRSLTCRYGKQDDLCIAIQLALIGTQRFYSDPKYARFRTTQWDARPPTGTGIVRNVRA